MLRLSALLGCIAAFVAGWYLGRDYEFRLWERINDEPPETTSLDPVPMKLTEFVALMTRDWGTDLRQEWEYNR